MKEGFLLCHDCGAITHENAKTWETTFYSLSKEEKEDFINFPSLSNLCIVLFMLLVFNKVFKTVSPVFFCGGGGVLYVF